MLFGWAMNLYRPGLGVSECRMGRCRGIELRELLSESYEDFFHSEVSAPLGYSLEFGDIDLCG